MDEIIGPTICDTTQVSNPVSLTVINVLLIWYTFASLPYIYNNKQFWTDYLFQMILSLILSIICYRIINIPSSFGYAICINDWESVNNYCNYHNYSKYVQYREYEQHLYETLDLELGYLKFLT